LGEPESLTELSAAPKRRYRPGAEVSPGSESTASAQGTAQEPGSPQRPRGRYAGRATGEQGSRLTVAGAGRRESERRAPTTVPLREGNEAKREG
jgi:hypothetical protein